MKNETMKAIVCIAGLTSVTVLQITAWAWGFNGSVFALTSAVVGGITGLALGIKINVTNSMGEYLHDKTK